jgi:hypothetical protein
VALLVEAEPKRFPGLVSAVHEVRAAGVELTLVARYVFLTLRIKGTIPPGLPPAGRDKIVSDVIDGVQTYVDGLASGAPAEGKELLDALAKVDGLSDPAIADVIPRRSDVTKPGVESLVDDLAAVLIPPPADETALRAALTGVLTSEATSAPTASKIPDRSLVHGPSGQRATDAEIAAATFEVTVPADGQVWWLVLDMSPDDVDLTVAGGS